MQQKIIQQDHNGRTAVVLFALVLPILGILAGIIAMESPMGRFIEVATAYALALCLAVIAIRRKALRTASLISALAVALPIIAVCVWSPLVGAGLEGLPHTDRLNYFYVYNSIDIQQLSTIMEGGFVTIMAVGRTLVSFQLFLVIISFSFFIGLARILYSLNAKQIFPISILIMLTYFAFWTGALNITRQFFAAGICFFGLSFLVGERRRWLVASAIIGLAVFIHGSAMIYFAVIPLELLNKRGKLIVALWISNIIFFIVNISKYSPLLILTNMSSKLQGYTDFSIQATGAEMFDAVAGTSNRIDFAAFLAAPMIIYAIIVMQKIKENRDSIDKFFLIYSVSCVPYFWLSFIYHSDRLAYYGFLTIPVIAVFSLQYIKNTTQQWLVYAVIIVLCVAQLTVGIYGYTPKLLILGL